MQISIFRGFTDFVRRVRNSLQTFNGSRPDNVMESLQRMRSFADGTPEDRQIWYDQLIAYYKSNSLYENDAFREFFKDKRLGEAVRSLRTCAQRSVEFYVSKLEPGAMPEAMPIIGPQQSVLDAIANIFLWSNFATQKPVVLRNFAMLGDVFIQTVVDVSTEEFDIDSDTGELIPRPNRVRHIFHSPQYITEYTEDAQGHIVEVRLDIPQGGLLYYVEIWDKSGYRVYNHDQGYNAPLDRIGEPTNQGSLEDLGITFVPFAHAKFRDVGLPFGINCFAHALDKIDEANAQSTRLHDILFRYNRPVWGALANMVDNQGLPLPAPTLEDAEVLSEDDTVVGMPGHSSLTSLVPNIQYTAALAIIDAQIKEIEKDLPELTYTDLKSQGNLSGVAIRELMSDPIDKIIEARGSFEAALIIANKHALTLGVVHKIFDASIGTYENKDFDHTFLVREVLPLNHMERAQALKTLTEAQIPIEVAMEILGYSKQIIDKVLQSVEKKRKQDEDALDRQMRNLSQDSGDQPPTGELDNEDDVS